MPRLVARARRSFSIRHAVHLAFAAAGVGAIVGACAPTTPSGPPGGGGADASAASVSGEPHAIAANAARLVAGDPSLASIIAPTKNGWTLVDASGADALHRYVSTGWRAADTRDNDGVGARFPATSDASFDVGLGQDPTRRATLTPIGASAAAGALHEGRVVFHDAWRSTDVVIGAARERVEELLVLRDASAPTSFAWKLALSSRMPTARIANGAIEMVSAKGEVLLRVARPYALDADGVRVDAALALDGDVMRIALDTTGLAFPIALDPTLETPIWTDVTPGSGNPTARVEFGMSFDSNAGNAVVFGGFAPARTNETWLWNGAAWSAGCTGTCVPPSARNDPAMAFNSNSGKNASVMFGGITAAGPVYACDTWEYSAGTWGTTGAKQAPSPCPSAGGTSPQARTQGAMVYAGALGVLLFGGGNSSTFFQDTWTWNGSGWTQQCTACGVGTLPAGRELHAMAYDASRARVVLFGGQKLGSVVLNDTWEWDGAAWAQKCLAPPCSNTVPAIRQNHVMTYDANRKKVVMTGGNDNGSTFYGGTWEWDGATWTPLTAENAATPVAHSYAGMVFDTVRRRTTLFGGLVSGVNSNKTWAFYTYGEGPCASAADCDTNLCLDGVCCTASCGACAICNGTSPGLCTNVTNIEAPRCMTTQYCNGSSACTAKAAAGGGCATNLECQNGLVCSSEGVCCNSVCNSDGCHSCLAAKTGGAAGSCLPISNGGAARSGCALSAQSTCGLDSMCDGAGACRKWVNGTNCLAQTCTGTTQTNASLCNGSGSCIAGSTQMCAAGYMCIAGNPPSCPTTCSADTVGGDAACASGFYCNGAMCVPKIANGQACTVRDGHCTNSHCNHDGICCDAACNSACESCTTARKGSGADGVCGPTAVDTDPYSLCTPGSTACGAPGKCDGVNRGAGGCLANAHNGTVCGATTCALNALSGLQCDGSGACLTANNVACAPYKCANGTTCAATCTGDGDCQQSGTGFFCDAAHHCTAKKAPGLSCSNANECAMANCVDGVCCDSPCGGQCAACNLAGKMGTCSPAMGPPVGTRTMCTAPGTTCGGSCNGTNSAACTYADATKECGAKCMGNMETLSACDSQGGCMVGSTRACPANLVCDPMAQKCKTACAVDADCTPAGSFVCDQVKHQCAPTAGATCSTDATSVVPPGGGAPTSCAPYVCSGTGCLQKCTSVSDCIAPNVCDTTGACVAPAAANGATGDSGGCSVASAGANGERGGFAWAALAGIGIAVMARRRKRAVSS